jgi:hypothetical protein
VPYSAGSWVNGLAEWVDGDTAYLSVAFTWKLDEAYSKAIYYRSLGYKVRAGGPGIFTRKHYLADVAELGGDVPDAIAQHNPMATFASRGCPVGCWFCIVPKMEGKAFTLLPDFPVRPILCDNNLSALPAEYQDHIVGRYKAAGVPLLDANSGFEPRTFDDEVLARWTPINRGPWRFASDDAPDGPPVERVMKMLDKHNVPSRRRQVYTMIGGEPFDACMDRIHRVIGMGGEPYAQPYMKLNTLVKKPTVRFDWTEHRLKSVARWVNGRFWKYVPFDRYDSSIKTRERNPDQMEMSTT